jgi:hypothetical protein
MEKIPVVIFCQLLPVGMPVGITPFLGFLCVNELQGGNDLIW